MLNHRLSPKTYANFYDYWLTFGGKQGNFIEDILIVALLKEPCWNLKHLNFSDIPKNLVLAKKEIKGKRIVLVRNNTKSFDANNLTFKNLPAGSKCSAFIVYVDKGHANKSPLLFYVGEESAWGLPVFFGQREAFFSDSVTIGWDNNINRIWNYG